MESAIKRLQDVRDHYAAEASKASAERQQDYIGVIHGIDIAIEALKDTNAVC